MDEESGGARHPPLMQRASAKRNFSTMSASHTPNPPYSFLAQRDSDYANEQPWRRRRIDLSDDESASEAGRPIHFPRDGFDFRRPVMSGSSSAPRRHEGETTSAVGTSAVIDLTDEDGTQESQGSEGIAVPSAEPVASSSRARRLPRFERDILDFEDDAEASDPDTSRLPGAVYLSHPARRPQFARRGRPHFSSLRRPARPPSPPTAMDEDEVEFVRARPLRNSASRQATPHELPTRNAPRSVTPYPIGQVDNVIDLTTEGDDDVVLVNARQRVGNNGEGGTNVAQPFAAVARDYGHLGQIANILREGGANLGGRLMQRLNGFGLDAINAEVRAMGQARDHFNYNHPHRNDAEPGDHHIPQPQPQPLARAGAMPFVLDYNMTAFDLGVPARNRPQTPKYEPPPAPGAGFTRSPAEDEVVVCPNCGDELAVGEGDAKQEIWVIKTCGHAYCGECAQNRTIRPKSKRSKGKTPAISHATGTAPFSKCVVEDCGKPAAKNSMFRIYLGT